VLSQLAERLLLLDVVGEGDEACKASFYLQSCLNLIEGLPALHELLNDHGLLSQYE
jgi:hypothetical protein